MQDEQEIKNGICLPGLTIVRVQKCTFELAKNGMNILGLVEGSVNHGRV